MKQKRDSNLKQFFYHSEPVNIVTNFHEDEIFIVTYVGLFNPETKKISIGLSFCNLTKEKNYNRKLGNEIAYGRALKRPLFILGLNNETTKDMKTIFTYFVNNLCKPIDLYQAITLQKLLPKR